MTPQFFIEIGHNETFWAGVAGWMVAQMAKGLGSLVEKRRIDASLLLQLGGMPSSHSASVSAVAISIGLRCGFDSAVAAIAIAFAAIVMIDAQSVRRAAGEQARLLNQIIDELFKEHRLSQEKLAELLGHTRLEVALGMVMGILIALLIHSFGISPVTAAPLQ